MRATEALQAALANGVEVILHGRDLVLEASTPPPEALLEALSQNKAEIVALLRPGDDGGQAEDWQVYYNERAAIAEFDGGLSRAQAEAQAFECCVVEWLNRNFERSPPEICLSCGGAGSSDDALLPYGVEPTGHAWLHWRCWPAWREGRREDAVAALKAMGIQDRSKGI